MRIESGGLLAFADDSAWGADRDRPRGGAWPPLARLVHLAWVRRGHESSHAMTDRFGLIGVGRHIVRRTIAGFATLRTGQRFKKC